MKKYMTQAMCVMVVLGFSFLGSTHDSEDSDGIIKISRDGVFIPERLGEINLYKDSDGSHVIKDDHIYDVQNCFCDSMLRKMSDEQLITFLGRNKPQIITITPDELDHIMDKNDFIEVTGEEKDELLGTLFGGGYIVVNQMSNGEYSLQAKGRLLGGGFWSEFWDSSKTYVYAGAGVVFCVCIVSMGVGAIGAIGYSAIAAGEAAAAAPAGAGLAAAWSAAGPAATVGFGVGVKVGAVLGAGIAAKAAYDKSGPAEQENARAEKEEARTRGAQCPASVEGHVIPTPAPRPTAQRKSPRRLPTINGAFGIPRTNLAAA